MGDRVILHSDLNSFYASVECAKNPSISGLPVAVVGSSDARHGIVLAANGIAKGYGVRTGDVRWQARMKCSQLLEIEADFSSYIEVSRAVREVYGEYTDRVEPYGIDECWLDVTDSVRLFGDGESIAHGIRERIKREFGMTVSVGVSFNKIFAKLASDMKKPDAVTVIARESFGEKVFSLPASELLYVGKATAKKLKKYNIQTIGDLAEADSAFLRRILGKWGDYIGGFARGEDISPVAMTGAEDDVKSVGNSLTYYRDLRGKEDIHALLVMLSESVAERILELGLGEARTVSLGLRDNALSSLGGQTKLSPPSSQRADITAAADRVMSRVWTGQPIRSAEVKAGDFISGSRQTSVFISETERDRQRSFSRAVLEIRKKYGNHAIRPAVLLRDKRGAEYDIKGEHVLHPYSFFRPRK